MRIRTLVIFFLIAVMLAGVFLQAQAAVEIRAASSSAVAGWQRVTTDGEPMWLSPTASLTAADIAGSQPDGRGGVAVVFTPDGARKMRALSAAQANQRIAVLLDGQVIWAPVVRSTIERDAVLSGLSPDQAKRLLAVLKSQ
jgi:preprotein translocase subunit SecD